MVVLEDLIRQSKHNLHEQQRVILEDIVGVSLDVLS